jgi:hypothetical protein
VRDSLTGENMNYEQVKIERLNDNSRENKAESNCEIIFSCKNCFRSL